MRNSRKQFPEMVGVRLPTEAKEKIEREAYDRHQSKSEFLRDLITNILIKVA
jgi:Arc/MetJ-type ribon-helix-helix transcriptional regulator